MKALLVLTAIFVLVEHVTAFTFCDEKDCGENSYCCGMKCEEYQPEGEPCYHARFYCILCEPGLICKKFRCTKETNWKYRT
uniref:U38-Theraphotoxin-Sfo1e_1 n=1 Tax=Selenotholus foelschei TaxID=1905327 RepID=A0A482Z865_9ARAC